MKRFLFILILLISSCERVEEHECVCYVNGTEEYDKYYMKNTKTDAYVYCSSISTELKTCKITE